MESNEKLKKFNIKNQMCYYFDGITKIEDFDFDILINGKSCKNVQVVDYHCIINSKYCQKCYHKYITKWAEKL